MNTPKSIIITSVILYSDGTTIAANSRIDDKGNGMDTGEVYEAFRFLGDQCLASMNDAGYEADSIVKGLLDDEDKPFLTYPDGSC